MPNEPGRRITDLAALKVFTHPLRIELWRALNAVRSATASQLADQVDEAVSLVSYHLRKMAEHGFIEEALGESSDGRERWWKTSEEHTFTFRSTDFDDDPRAPRWPPRSSGSSRRPARPATPRTSTRPHTWPAAWSDAVLQLGVRPAPHRRRTPAGRRGVQRAGRPLDRARTRGRKQPGTPRGANTSPSTSTASPSGRDRGRHAPARPPARPAHRDGNVLRWLTAYAASAVGDNVYFLALGWAAAAGRAAREVGMVMAASAVPRAVLMLGGGVVADRFGPRLVVIGSDAVRAPSSWPSRRARPHHPGLWLLVTVALVFGTSTRSSCPRWARCRPASPHATSWPASRACAPSSSAIGNTTGPPLSGFVMAFGGVAAAFALAGGLFAVSLVLLLAVRIAPLPAGTPPPSRGPPATGQVGAGGTGGATADGLARTGRRAALSAAPSAARPARPERRALRVRPRRAAQRRSGAARRRARLGRARVWPGSSARFGDRRGAERAAAHRTGAAAARRARCRAAPSSWPPPASRRSA